MLTYAMDFDPRITSDGNGWHCNFHFGYEDDVIEDATNEKSCEQALQYLISKADAEINDLEDELAMLRCQVKWADTDEQRDPYEVCCVTFKRKIDNLTESIKNIRNGNTLKDYDVGTTFKIQRPVERIYDIINALIKQNFSASNEQVGDLSIEMDLLLNSGSVDIGTDLGQKETTVESSAESRELMTDCECQSKPMETISEESCSDTARYAIKNATEARDLGKTDDEMTGKAEVDAYDCTAEGKNAYNHNENLKSQALQHGDIEFCVTGLKGSSLSSAKREVIVKIEVDDTDMHTQHVAADSLCKTRDQGSADAVQCQQDAVHSQSIDNYPITYGRKQSSMSAILTPQGRKLQRAVGGVRKSNSKVLETQWKIGKRKLPANMNDLRQSNSPSEVEQKFRCLSETNFHRNHPRLLGANKQELKGASSENPTQSKEVGVSKGDDVCARGNLASKLQHELVMCLRSSRPAEGIASAVNSCLANSHNFEIKSSILVKVDTKELPTYNTEGLREKLSQEPDFLHKLKVPELKAILKLNNVRKCSKLKKEKMIEELNKLLNAT